MKLTNEDSQNSIAQEVMDAQVNARRRHAELAPVTLAWCRRSDVHGRFSESLLEIMRNDTMMSEVAGQGAHITRPGGGFISLQSGPRIAEARSQIVDAYLTDEKYSESKWLLVMDTDMVVPGDIVPRMLANASLLHCPILGALCFVGSPYGRQYPTVYRSYVDDDGGYAVEPVDELPEGGGLVKVGATGCGCILIHRQVLIGMANRFSLLPNGERNPYPWFTEGLTTKRGVPLGEDISFCHKATVMGIPIHVDLDLEVGHIKEGELNRATFEQYRERREVGAGVLVDSS